MTMEERDSYTPAEVAEMCRDYHTIGSIRELEKRLDSLRRADLLMPELSSSFDITENSFDTPDSISIIRPGLRLPANVQEELERQAIMQKYPISAYFARASQPSNVRFDTHPLDTDPDGLSGSDERFPTYISTDKLANYEKEFNPSSLLDIKLPKPKPF